MKSTKIKTKNNRIEKHQRKRTLIVYQKGYEKKKLENIRSEVSKKE